MNLKTTTLFIAVATLAGCATAPKPLRGEFSAVAPQQASSSQATGDLVRWGGRIVSVTPDDARTCFEILGRDLGDTARPTRAGDVSTGRFLACRTGFYDPAIFAPDRDVTITGRIAGFETRPIGEYEYRYPTVAADVIYLWPERTEQDLYYRQTMFWPSYRPIGWGWGGYYMPVRAPYRHQALPTSAPAPAPAAPKP